MTPFLKSLSATLFIPLALACASKPDMMGYLEELKKIQTKGLQTKGLPGISPKIQLPYMPIKSDADIFKALMNKNLEKESLEIFANQLKSMMHKAFAELNQQETETNTVASVQASTLVPNFSVTIPTINPVLMPLTEETTSPSSQPKEEESTSDSDEN